MQTPPASGGSRMSGWAIAGLVLLGALLGCMAGALLGGTGGFLTGRTLENRARVAAERQVTDLQRQLREQSARPAPTTPSSGAAPAQATPRAGATQVPAQATPRAGGTQAPAQTTPRATAPASGSRATSTPQAGAPAQPGVYLGVRYNVLNPDIAAQAGITITQGALIGEVVPNSPAAQAGFQPRDIVTAIDGKALDERYTLADAVTSRKPGDKVAFTVVRDGQTMTLNATLAAPPSGAFDTPTPAARPGGGTSIPPRPGTGVTATPSSGTPAATPRSPGGAPQGTATAPRPAMAPPTQGGNVATTRAYLGVQVTPVSEQVAQARGLKDANGALIQMVMPASPAFRAGLFDDDIILAVDGVAVDANHSLTTLVTAKKPGDTVKVRAIRGGKEEELTVTLGSVPAEYNENRP